MEAEGALSADAEAESLQQGTNCITVSTICGEDKVLALVNDGLQRAMEVSPFFINVLVQAQTWMQIKVVAEYRRRTNSMSSRVLDIAVGPSLDALERPDEQVKSKVKLASYLRNVIGLVPVPGTTNPLNYRHNKRPVAQHVTARTNAQKRNLLEEVEAVEVEAVSHDTTTLVQAMVTEVGSQAHHAVVTAASGWAWVNRASDLLRRGKMSTERIATQVRRAAQVNGEEISQEGFDSLLEDEQIPEAYALQLQDELGL